MRNSARNVVPLSVRQSQLAPMLQRPRLRAVRFASDLKHKTRLAR
jgi:hypothetical protein